MRRENKKKGEERRGGFEAAIVAPSIDLTPSENLNENALFPYLGHRLPVAVVVVLGEAQRRGDPADVQGRRGVRDVDVRGHGRDAIELDALQRRLDCCCGCSGHFREGGDGGAREQS